MAAGQRARPCSQNCQEFGVSISGNQDWNSDGDIVAKRCGEERGARRLPAAHGALGASRQTAEHRAAVRDARSQRPKLESSVRRHATRRQGTSPVYRFQNKSTVTRSAHVNIYCMLVMQLYYSFQQ